MRYKTCFLRQPMVAGAIVTAQFGEQNGTIGAAGMTTHANNGSVVAMVGSEIGKKSAAVLRAAAAGSLILLLAACGGGQDEDTYVARDVNVLYNLAMDSLERGRVQLAAAAFDEVERQHPYSSWARKAQLMAAYSHYLSNSYDDAILSSERFLALHPGNKDAPYAYYLIGLSYYEQIVDVGRDQRLTEQARDALLEVVRRFPDTEYARDAQVKLDLVLDHLAGKEMEVGRFYLRQREFLGAMMRFRRVVENYQTTTHVPEALHRLTECYLALGVEEEARASAAVLGYNYPNNKWYRYSYALLTNEGLEPGGSDKSWLGRVFDIF